MKRCLSVIYSIQVKGEMPEGKKNCLILFSPFRSWNYKGGSLMTLSLTVLLLSQSHYMPIFGRFQRIVVSETCDQAGGF